MRTLMTHSKYLGQVLINGIPPKFISALDFTGFRTQIMLN